MITQAERAQIKQILQSPGWRAVEQIATNLINQIREVSNLKDSEWETAKGVAVEEGYVQGINALIQELYKEAGSDA